ncbi:hypothetical protein EC957_002592 [Mortierella hygrophila]|uniref:Uncharacterized protein n=1 Tax=Mortierella hygrophila TaxID=979708 RepID=A0A9P6F513_9FUNG|nr:hypothetical protein EC957_002592 [Mortierella hygrophila]
MKISFAIAAILRALLAAIPTVTAFPAARASMRAPEQPIHRDVGSGMNQGFPEGLERIARISLLQVHQVPNANDPATAAEPLVLNPSGALLEAIRIFAAAYEELAKEARSRETSSEEAMVESFETAQALANGLKRLDRGLHKSKDVVAK